MEGAPEQRLRRRHPLVFGAEQLGGAQLAAQRVHVGILLLVPHLAAQRSSR